MKLDPSPTGLVSLYEVGLRTQTHTQDGRVRAQGGGGVCKKRRVVSEGTRCAGTLILAFQAPELGRYTSAVYPGLGSSVMAA